MNKKQERLKMNEQISCKSRMNEWKKYRYLFIYKERKKERKEGRKGRLKESKINRRWRNTYAMKINDRKKNKWEEMNER